MAAGFKTAQVNASLVPSTQTNFPSYVDLSRLGITTLAEAQSVRVYADSAKTTEWAREIVSVTEMHVKVPSLTSTVQIYVDYDGVRADYAATDTYGRNAVWSDYSYVAHMESNPNNSTGGTDPSTNSNMTYSSSNGKIGGGAYCNGTNNAIRIDLAIPTTHTIQYWLNFDSTTASNSRVISKDNSSSDRNLAHERSGSGIDRYQWNSGGSIRNANVGTINTSTWYLLHTTWNSSGNYIGYSNGSSVTSTATSGNARNSSALLNIGYENALGRRMTGNLDEMRIRTSVLSANWITTEYNNQNNESSFWGTWTDVGGATPRGGILLAW